jgi:hypothetical protein
MATIDITVHPKWDLTEKIVTGDLTIVEVTAELARFYAGPITKHVLWDFSRATFASIGAADVADFSTTAVSLLRSRWGGKSAIVSTSGLGFGMSRMYEAYRETNQDELPYMTFSTRQEAIDWLRSDLL